MGEGAIRMSHMHIGMPGLAMFCRFFGANRLREVDISESEARGKQRGDG
jgi:hypothetical protein